MLFCIRYPSNEELLDKYIVNGNFFCQDVYNRALEKKYQEARQRSLQIPNRVPPGQTKVIDNSKRINQNLISARRNREKTSYGYDNIQRISLTTTLLERLYPIR